ncbi:MAG TPA: DUF916 domain-containing protein [Acidimicrobiales bacterium]|nr:DUF916 domain-containing protein [Acidimicrobiales bacterium]
MHRFDARLRAITLLAAVLAAASGAFGATGAAAASAGGISLRPGHVDPNDPATRAYFKPTVAPGGTYSDFVAVTNTSDSPLDLIASAVDGLTGVTSGAVYANRQDPVRKAGEWVQMATPEFTLAPHAERDIAFTVRVPSDAPPGDHLAGLAFENAHPQTSSGNFAVTEVIRSVMGVQVLVPGPAVFHVHVDGLQIQPAPGLGTASVIVTLGNDGLRLGKPVLTVTLDGPRAYHRSVSRPLDTILPGDTIAFPLAWPDTLPSGDYAVTAELIGAGQSASTKATIHLGASVQGAVPASAPPAAPTHKTSHSFTWLLLLLIPLAIGAGIAIGRRSGHQQAPTPQQDLVLPEPEPEGSGRRSS